MNWVDCLLGWLLGLGTGLVICAWESVKADRKRWKLQNEMFKLRQEGFIAGMDIGTRNHAIWINNHGGGLRVNGFAIACDKCHITLAAIQPAGEEYHRCPKCGHRNPAPLAPEKEAHDEH